MAGREYIDHLIVKTALNSKCIICDEKIKAFQLWGFVETQRKTTYFYHQSCLKRKEEKTNENV